MEVVNNTDNMKFEIAVSPYLADLQYRMVEQTMYLMHTSVPAELSGQGMASRMAVAALEHARSHQLKIVVYCPFMVNYLKKHPEHLDLIDQNRQEISRFTS